MSNMVTAFIVLLICIFPLCSTSGQFEIELERLVNPKGLNVNGSCCHGPNGFLTCLQSCRTFIRFCLRNVNPNVDHLNQLYPRTNEECNYGFDETPILGGNSIDFTGVRQQANRIVLPFKFSWMGDFVLHIDIFNDRTYDSQPYPGSERDLILSTTIRSSIEPNTNWQHSQTIDSSLNAHQFSFRYRVACSQNFYGVQCARFCSPLSIHSRCDPNTGDVLCEQGWTGTDCNQAICRENCQHGHCTNQPGQCICHSGWTGTHCERSLKNQTEQQPARCPECLHGGKCLGSTCQCPRGYRGRRCEERICFNGGLSSMGKCRCPPNYQGEQCEIESKCPICRNGGQCVENKCICSNDFIGQYCEINIQLLQKKPSPSLISMEFLILITFIVLFLIGLIIISCLFFKYVSQRQKQLQQMKEINLEKIWTIDTNPKNIYHEENSSKDKVNETKDINTKLKQVDVHGSLV